MLQESFIGIETWKLDGRLVQAGNWSPKGGSVAAIGHVAALVRSRSVG